MPSLAELLPQIPQAELCVRCEAYKGCLFVSALLAAVNNFPQGWKRIPDLLENPHFNTECPGSKEITLIANRYYQKKSGIKKKASLKKSE